MRRSGGKGSGVSHEVPALPGERLVHGLQILTVDITKEMCKNGGWQTLTRADGSSFNNQGDCIQYANTGK